MLVPLALALEPPAIYAQPGPEYAASTRPFQGIPGIERAPNGRLWATWYAGGETEGPENYVTLATSGDDGATWTEPVLIINPSENIRAYDPCLWHDPEGKLWLFWAQGASWWDGRAGVWAITTEESDKADARWSEPRRLCDGVMMCKPTVLSTGRWLLPAAVWKGAPSQLISQDFAVDNSESHGAWVVATDDGGKSFYQLGRARVPESVFDEHMVVERRDGSLWMLVRTRYGAGEAFSNDGGVTWTGEGPSATVTHISNGGARLFIRRLASGRLLLVKHNPPNGKDRSHLTAFLSGDDGRTWRGGLVLDERGGVSYPDGIETADGTQYIIYDYSRTGEREILMATFTEEDVLAGAPVSSQCRLRTLVSKGGQ